MSGFVAKTCPVMQIPTQGLLLLCCSLLQSGLINQFPFDPAGMYSKDMAVKEVKNGRLAMVRCTASSSSRQQLMCKQQQQQNTEEQQLQYLQLPQKVYIVQLTDLLHEHFFYQQHLQHTCMLSLTDLLHNHLVHMVL
jgi:hypothetical protein